MRVLVFCVLSVFFLFSAPVLSYGFEKSIYEGETYTKDGFPRDHIVIHIDEHGGKIDVENGSCSVLLHAPEVVRNGDIKAHFASDASCIGCGSCASGYIEILSGYMLYINNGIRTVLQGEVNGGPVRSKDQ